MKNGPYELVVAPPSYPGKLYRGKYCYQHHLVWWQNTGETIGENEVIHHKNEVKTDNRFDNLEKTTKVKHKKHHGNAAHEKLANKLVCRQCSKEFLVYGHHLT